MTPKLLAAMLALCALAAHAQRVPDAEFTNQDGQKVRFYSDLVHDKVVVVNFIFTSCSTICPTMGINFGQLQSRIGDDVRLISVSIDPANDTPARLKAWGKRWNAGPHWTLLTGPQANVDALRKAFGVYTADVANHTSIAMIGDGRTDNWTRIDGLAPPAKIAEAIAALKSQGAASHYFQNLKLVDQNGRTVDLFDDLMADKVVVIDSFFVTCKGVCPVMSATMRKIDLAFPKDANLSLISISVDPENDTPKALRDYATRFNAGERWHFLTGSKEQVGAALAKLGMAVEDRDSHVNILVVGNMRTGLWKKVLGIAGPDKVVEVVRTVVDDRGE